MTRKQKKILIRILTSAVLLVLLHFLPLSDILENVFGSSDDGAAPILRRAAMIVIYLIPYLIVGLDVIKGAIKKIGTGDFLDEEFLMMVATAGAFAIGEYPEATAVMLFYQVGELFQSIAVGKSRKSIAAMMDICPDTAIVLRDGAEEEVDPSEVLVGETVLVKPGEKVPIDGVISEGSTEYRSTDGREPAGRGRSRKLRVFGLDQPEFRDQGHDHDRVREQHRGAHPRAGRKQHR